MSKTIYILQNTYYSEQDWEVFTSLKEAEEAMHTNIVFEMPENREARAKELVIITKII